MTAAQLKLSWLTFVLRQKLRRRVRLKGALVANYSAPDFVDQFKALGAKPDDDIELYCRSGRRAEMASQISASSDIKISVIWRLVKPLPLNDHL